MNGLIFGCGYLGSRVAQCWLDRGDSVVGVTRSDQRASQLQEVGLQTVIGDVTDSKSLVDLPPVDLVLYAVSYDRRSSASREATIVSGTRNMLRAIEGKCRGLVFISTSSVYGVTNGEWVDENSPVEPDSEAGKLARDAECLVTASSINTVILRFTGLYGPQRLLRRIGQFSEQEPISGRGEAWLNLVHVDDAVQAVKQAGDLLLRNESSEDISNRKAIYLVSNDVPLRREVYYRRLAEAAGAPEPQFDGAKQQGRITGLGKRCRNDIAKSELKWAPGYPEVTIKHLREQIAQTQGEGL